MNYPPRVLWKLLGSITAFLLVANIPIISAEETTTDKLKQTLVEIDEQPRTIHCDAGSMVIPKGGHFQGVQFASVRGLPHIVLSGSSDEESYLMLLEMEATDKAKVTAKKTLLPKPFKHAGGFQVVGDYLAVGIEDNDGKDQSKVWILEVDQLCEGSIAPLVTIERQGAPKRSTAGALGLAQMGDRWILAVGSWDSATIDFYESNGKALSHADCQFTLKATWEAEPYGLSYQNLNLLAPHESSLYLLGFAQNSHDHVAVLFQLDLNAPPKKCLTKLESRNLKPQSTSFRSGAGAVYSPSRGLEILSCGHRTFAIERFVRATD